MTELGWCFLRENRHLTYPPWILVKPGIVLRRKATQIGNHIFGPRWSKRALDALGYARGAVICRVECSGKTLYSADYAVSEIWHVLWMADATDTLRGFAEWCTSGDKGIKGSVWKAALNAAQNAALNAAQNAVWGSEWDPTWDPARESTWTPQRIAAWEAARKKQNNKLEKMLMGLEEK